MPKVAHLPQKKTWQKAGGHLVFRIPEITIAASKKKERKIAEEGRKTAAVRRRVATPPLPDVFLTIEFSTTTAAPFKSNSTYAYPIHTTQ